MIAVALALAAAPPKAAPATPYNPPGVFGAMGDKKCSELRAENVGLIGDYILGFWSGMNVAANTPDVGHSTNARGIVVEVVRACAIPSAADLPLSLATLAIHMKFQREHR